MRIFLFYLSIIYGITIQAQTPVETGLNSINRINAESHIYFLADDLLEGREAGSRGGKIAGSYIVSCLKQYGIQSFKDSSYYQPFEVLFKDEKLFLKNILGKIEGKKKDEYIIVGAHYDHLGTDSTLIGDQIYNGADDNASGVSAVLQIAKAFAISGKQPERSIIFAFWDGEEKKLLGSNFFVETFPDLYRVKGYLNFDMIGRNHDELNPAHVDYFFAEEYPIFSEWLKNDISTYNLAIKPTYKPAAQTLGGSDNVSFGQKGIPIMWFHTDGHPDYHKPTDHSDKLNWNKIVDITKAAFLLAWKWADSIENN